MKHKLPFLFLIFSLFCLLACLCWAFTCGADYRALCADPAVSGVDFLGVGFLYGLGFVFCALPGLIFSGLLRRFSAGKAMHVSSYILTVFFVLCLLAFPILWFFGPGHP